MRIYFQFNFFFKQKYLILIIAFFILINISSVLGSESVLIDLNKNIPIISIQPVSQLKCLNQHAQFKLNAVGVALQYQWYKNDSVYSNTTNILTLSYVSYLDTGNYYCRVSNAYGEVISDIVRLDINSKHIIQQPTSILACPNDSVQFNVVAIGSGIIYKWMKNNNYLTGQTQNHLKLYNVSTTDIASYKCVLQNVCGSMSSNNATLSLNPPVVTGNPQNRNICVGDSVELSVIASGSGIQYQWYHNGIDLLGETLNKYKITYATIADTGAYYCVINNSCGSDTSAIAVITIKTTTITLQPYSQYKCLGNSIQFKVTASGSTLTYQWKKDGTMIPNAVSNTYQIVNINQTKAGVYKCEINNSCNNILVSDTAWLRINNPTISLQPISVEKCIGDTAMLIVNAQGYNVSYYWRKNGLPLSGKTNDTLLINGLKAIDSASYYCYVYTTCSGLNSENVVLNVHNPKINFIAIADTNTNCIGSATANITGGSSPYLYNWNDSLFQTTLTANFLCSGYYSLVVTDSLGCVKIDSVFIGNILTSILSLFDSKNISIYPNPVSDGFINLKITNQISKKINVTLTDNVGKDVMNINYKNFNSNEKINISNLPTGIYYLNIMIDGFEKKSFKIIIYN